MTNTNLPISIIIPTHNRLDSLRRMLAQLSKQSFPADQFEVIIVADGCTDDSVAFVKAYDAPFALRVLEQGGQGAATARNVGAAIARGRFLIFVDDDIEPSTEFVAGHWQAHGERTHTAAVGYLPPILSGQPGYFRNSLQSWWEEMFRNLRTEGHRFSYREFFSGNCSMAATLFASVGGFDPAFRSCYDDYEFGLRLLKAGSSFVYSDTAWGYHHETRDLPGLMRRKFQEGKAEVLLGRRHPEMKGDLLITRFASYSPLVSRLMTTLAFRLPQQADKLALRVPTLLNWLEKLHLHSLWHWLMGILSLYWYYRGLTTELGDAAALAQFLSDAHEPPASETLDLDLAEGLAKAAQRLDQAQPQALQIRYGKASIGTIPMKLGGERLSAKHLRPLLATTLNKPLLDVLIKEGALTANPDEQWIGEFLQAEQARR